MVHFSDQMERIWYKLNRAYSLQVKRAADMGGRGKKLVELVFVVYGNNVEKC